MSKKNTQKENVTLPKKVYNFCSKKKLILGVVIAVLVVFIAGAVIRGIHLAIEFKAVPLSPTHIRAISTQTTSLQM